MNFDSHLGVRDFSFPMHSHNIFHFCNFDCIMLMYATLHVAEIAQLLKLVAVQYNCSFIISHGRVSIPL